MSAIAKFLIWISIFIVTNLIASANPINIVPIIYYIPLFIVTFNFMRPKEVVKQGFVSDPKFLSVLKAVMTLLAALVASGVDIPILSQIIDAITHILGNAEGIDKAVELIIAFVLGLYSIFAKKEGALGFVANGFKSLPKQPREINL